MRFGSSKSLADLEAIRAGRISTPDNEDVYTARKLGRLALFYCAFEILLSAAVGVMWNSYETGAMGSIIVLHYIAFRLLLVFKRMVDQIYFIRDEVRIARNQVRPESQIGLLHQSHRSVDTLALLDDYSMQTVSPSSSRPGSFISQRSGTKEEQTEFSPPGRVDTEADIGLVPLAKRKTFPPQQRGEDA